MLLKTFFSYLMNLNLRILLLLAIPNLTLATININKNTKPLKSDTTSSPTSPFVQIMPGTFIIGSPANEPGRYGENQSQVTISQIFEIQITEVTQAQWVQVMGTNPSYFSKKEFCPDSHAIRNQISMCMYNPVENVSWFDTQYFFQRLNSMNDGYFYRLPTEAEWEYAARAGTTSAFSSEIM